MDALIEQNEMTQASKAESDFGRHLTEMVLRAARADIANELLKLGGDDTNINRYCQMNTPPFTSSEIGLVKAMMRVILQEAVFEAMQIVARKLTVLPPKDER